MVRKRKVPSPADTYIHNKYQTWNVLGISGCCTPGATVDHTRLFLLIVLNFIHEISSMPRESVVPSHPGHRRTVSAKTHYVHSTQTATTSTRSVDYESIQPPLATNKLSSRVVSSVRRTLLRPSSKSRRSESKVRYLALGGNICLM